MTEPIPPEEQYETDTIFSQEDDVPDSYLQTKLRELESDNEIFSDSENNHGIDEYLTIDLPTPTAVDSDSFKKLVENSKFLFGNGDSLGDGAEFDSLVFQDELYDVTKDSFRYGRVTSGPSYNLMTGKMKESVLESVKERDEENDEMVETVTEDAETHRITTEVRIPLNGSEPEHLGNVDPAQLSEIYAAQMPNFFEYRKTFPEIRGIWTLLFDQHHYSQMSTFELQAGICAALNSKHFQIICIGVDEYNTVTGVEMSATDRVVFRMALTRAVAGEFQPPLVKVPPKQITGVSPMKRDVSELTTCIDVLFIPVVGVPTPPTESGDSSPPSRFLIVVRVKELSEKLYQLSSGRIYVENDGRVVEMESLNEAFRKLIIDKTEQKSATIGSLFMLEPEPFVEDSLLEVEECSSDDEDSDSEDEADVKILKKHAPEPSKAPEAENLVSDSVKQIEENQKLKKKTSKLIRSMSEAVLSRLDTPHAQNFGWLLFASVVAYGVYKTYKKC